MNNQNTALDRTGNRLAALDLGGVATAVGIWIAASIIQPHGAVSVVMLVAVLISLVTAVVSGLLLLLFEYIFVGQGH